MTMRLVSIGTVLLFISACGGGNGGSSSNNQTDFSDFVAGELNSSSDSTHPREINNRNFIFNEDETRFDTFF